MRRLAHLVAALTIGLLVALSAGAIVRADGLPSPLDGVTVGPDGSDLKQVAEGYGLACQPDTGYTGLAEWFCVRTDSGSTLSLSATFYADPALVMEAFAFTTDLSAPEPAAFVTEMTQPFCPDSGADAVAAFVNTTMAAGPGSESRTFEDTTCRLLLTYTGSAGAGNGSANLAMLAFSKGDEAGATAQPNPGSSAAPTGGGVSPTGERSPGSFARAVAVPDRVSTDPVVLLESGLLALAVVFLMPFPAQLFNSTLEEHWDEVRGWFGLNRVAGAVNGIAGIWNRPAGLVLFLVVSALLYGLLDPGFGFSLDSLAELFGLALGIAITTVAFAAPSILAHRRGGDGWRLQALPGTLLVGIGCVLVSRLTDFQPGYLYGLVIGVQFGRELSSAEEGRETALAALIMLASAAVAWLALAALGNGDLGVAGLALQTALAATMVAGLEGVVFGLLPLRFLPGEPLYAWNRLIWGALLAIGAFAFFHILVNPESGYLSDSSRTPLVTITALFVGFGALSVAFWGYFRFRPPRPGAPA